jgi:hypothetical protein
MKLSILFLLVSAACAADDPPDSVNHARIHIKSVDLASASFEVYFVPGPDALLTQVILSADRHAPAGLDAVFQTLENLLVEKYGHPWKSDEGGVTKVQWSLPATTITLSKIKIAAFGPETWSVNLIYTRRMASDSDKL